MIKVSLFDTSLIFWPWLMTTISHTRQRGWVEEMQPLGKSNPWLSHTFFFILCFVSFQNKVMSLRSVTSRQFMVLGSISFILLCFVLFCLFFFFLFLFLPNWLQRRLTKVKQNMEVQALLLSSKFCLLFDIFWATNQKCFSFQSFVIQEYRKDNICCKVLFTYIINKYRFLKRTEIPNENDFDNIKSAASLLADVCMYLQ